MPSRRITLKQVAEVAGVHPTTVSMAIRNHPRIPEKTRDRLKKLAEEMGYIPDPMLASLNAYRHNLAEKRFIGKIAWLNICTDLDWPKKTYFIQDYFKGASMRAKSLGYELEVFNAHPKIIRTRRLQVVLLSRNIQGIIIAPLQTGDPDSVKTIDLEWENFCSITFGYSLESPELNRITNDHYHSVIEALRKLHQLGYKKPGLFLSRKNNARIERLWEAGYLIGLRTIFKINPLPICLFESKNERESALKSWFEAVEPDVIIAQDDESLRSSLEKRIIPVPERASVVLLEESKSGYPYIDQNNIEIGSAAINLLVGTLHRHEHGLPSTPTVTLLKGKWKDGGTADIRHNRS